MRVDKSVAMTEGRREQEGDVRRIVTKRKIGVQGRIRYTVDARRASNSSLKELLLCHSKHIPYIEGVLHPKQAEKYGSRAEGAKFR